MKTFTTAEVKTILATCKLDPNDHDKDNQGQILFYTYTGVYEWEDGSFHDEPDPLLE